MKVRRRTRGRQAAVETRFEDIAKPSSVTIDYEAVARLITPEPPRWLLEHLGRWSSSVWLQSAVMAFQPSRVQMRERLRSVETAVATLRKALGDRPSHGFLDAAGAEKIAYHGVVDAHLADLGARAKKALSSSELAKPDGKTKAGRGPALPSGAIYPASLCALIVVEAWKHFRGAYPGARNEKACEAAELLWSLGANRRSSWGTNRLTAWRRPFEEAMSPAFDEQRADVVRHLKQSEHFANRLVPGADPGVDSNHPSEGAV